MKRSFWYRFISLGLITLACLLMLVPSFVKIDEKSSFPFKSKVNLGLDLQGGLYIIMGIDFKKVYADEVKIYLRRLESYLKDQGFVVTIGNLDLSDARDPKGSLILEDAKNIQVVKEKIKEAGFDSLLRFTSQTETTLTYALTQATRDQIEEGAVSKSIEVIRNRIDEFGVAEPEITSQGKDRIVIQLPGVKDVERAKALIGKTAKLEFKIVNDTVDPAVFETWMTKIKTAGIEYKKGERFSDYVAKVNEILRKDLPQGYELAFEKKENKTEGGLEQNIPYLVETVARLTGDDLQDAAVRPDPQTNMPTVSMTFSASGANVFKNVTTDNVNKRLAIILDGNVYTAPVINTPIPNGNAVITMGGARVYNEILQEAREIALVLRAGALPVQLEFEEQRVVGPSLGADSIKSAKIAALVGALFAFLFILIYYKFSGFIANVTLVLNVLIIMSVLIFMGATLTLPGIAGIALTIGMAVDANILIYERIKEELAKGMKTLNAVQAGFDQAFWTILDANITTALAGFCLLNFGTGPVRGFAVTLLIGIASTIYTAYFVSKIFFEIYTMKNPEKISI
ncbi:MAG: protein translocase subunit SecD [Bacteriovoracaceae bacterium]|nr:protein translocase subunit SecD [Bacteriovoracaceae bacterium]